MLTFDTTIHVIGISFLLFSYFIPNYIRNIYTTGFLALQRALGPYTLVPCLYKRVFILQFCYIEDEWLVVKGCQ